MKIHFIGIGGIGVSALAGYYLANGNLVSGSDLSASPTTESLEKQGAEIFIGPHNSNNVKNDIDLVVRTAATPGKNPELRRAKKFGIKTQLYAEALGDLTRQMHTIAVSGMHGKSTTTAMIALMMEKAGLDPTVIVGTKLREWENSNYRVGKSKYLVIEADEYNASFLNYWPKVIVLTNIEEEHLDFYKDLNHIMKTFGEYVSHLGEDGILVANKQDDNVMKVAQNVKCAVVSFRDSVPLKGTESLKLRVPGQHNASNAMAALAVARILKIPQKKAVEALNEFTGTWRRMEYRGDLNGAKIYDDYGHHPTEIKATLRGARELLKIHPSPPLGKEGVNGTLYCVFQPHQYQRTYKLFDQFIDAFVSADRTIILPIFSVPGREKDSIKEKVNSKMLAKAIIRSKKPGISGKQQAVVYLNSFLKAKNYLKKNLKKGDVVVVMGAGDIYQLTEMLLQ